MDCEGVRDLITNFVNPKDRINLAVVFRGKYFASLLGDICRATRFIRLKSYRFETLLLNRIDILASIYVQCGYPDQKVMSDRFMSVVKHGALEHVREFVNVHGDPGEFDLFNGLCHATRCCRVEVSEYLVCVGAPIQYHGQDVFSNLLFPRHERVVTRIVALGAFPSDKIALLNIKLMQDLGVYSPILLESYLRFTAPEYTITIPSLNAYVEAGHVECIEIIVKYGRVQKDWANCISPASIEIASKRGYSETVALVLAHRS